MTSSLYPWKIEVRNGALQRVGELDDYQSLAMQLKFDDVSKWVLEIDSRNRLAGDLLADNAGIIVSRYGNTVLSGSWDSYAYQQDVDSSKITVSGSDDTIWLQKREGEPEPSTASPPYSTNKEDVRTGIASSVMCLYVIFDAGPGAPKAGRNVFAGYTDAAFGASVTGRARWQNLLLLFQDLAAKGVVNGIQPGFRVIQQDTGLWFETYQPADLTAQIVFSFGLGNIKSLNLKRSAPEANYFYLGGQGDGTARTISEQPNSASIATWGRRELFVDAASATNSTELAQEATKADTDNQASLSCAVTPIDLPNMAFGVDYGLGDRVTVVTNVAGPGGDTEAGLVIQDIVRECAIRLTPDATTITPAIGTDGSAVSPIKFLPRIRSLETRMNNKERQ